MEPITLDQLWVFAAVVDAGSFSGAARKLSRAQSAVSYAIANLERLLELELFDRSGRTPVLTEAGRALLEDARSIKLQVDRLLARARQMHEGREAQISLAVDLLFPLDILLDALEQFRERFPDVAVQLHNESLGVVAERVAEGSALAGISVPLATFPIGLEQEPFWSLDMVPVVSPGHPLAKIDGPIAASVLREHRQIVLSDRGQLTAGTDIAVLGESSWRVADLEAKQHCLERGMGWGNLPDHRVATALEKGRLARIHVADWGERGSELRHVLIHRASHPPGPALRWLLDTLRTKSPLGGPQPED